MTIRETCAASIVVLLLFINMNIATAAHGADMSDGQLIKAHMQSIGDTVYGPEVAATVTLLEQQTDNLNDVLNFFQLENAPSAADPELRAWWLATRDALHSRSELPALINSKQAKQFLLLNNRSSGTARVVQINEYRREVYEFMGGDYAVLRRAIDTIPLAMVDSEMQALEQEFAQIFDMMAGADEKVRNDINLIATVHLAQYGKERWACGEKDPVKLADQRTVFRNRLHRLRDERSGVGNKPNADSAALAAINRLLDNLLSVDREGRIVQMQSLTRSRYCRIPELEQLAIKFRQGFLPVILPPEEFHPL